MVHSSIRVGSHIQNSESIQPSDTGYVAVMFRDDLDKRKHRSHRATKNQLIKMKICIGLQYNPGKEGHLRVTVKRIAARNAKSTVVHKIAGLHGIAGQGVKGII
jgi:hypothetical protein